MVERGGGPWAALRAKLELERRTGVGGSMGDDKDELDRIDDTDDFLMLTEGLLAPGRRWLSSSGAKASPLLPFRPRC